MGASSITVTNNGYGVVKTLSAYICSPARDQISRIKGITAFDVMAKGLNDFSQISFEVQKYIINQSTLKHEKNEAYAKLHAFCEIRIREFGDSGYFIILTEPEIVASGSMNERKVFTAMSYEAVLQYENLVNFKINCGTDDSLEMYSDNLNELGIPKNNIQLYNSSNPKLSLLDLVLHDDYYGWSVGEVDVDLAGLQRSFEIDTQNVYSFLCSDLAKAFRCVVIFDTVHKKINVKKIETFGNDTNIYLSLDHFLSQIDVAPQTEDIYTVFNVKGENDLDIAAVNFGSNKIVNIAYPLSLVNKNTQDKYKYYQIYRESLRSQYEDDQKEYLVKKQKLDSIMDRQPIEEITYNWSSTTYYPDETLATFLATAQSIVTTIEGSYKNKTTGKVDMDELNDSPDASMYHCYKDIIIPDVTNEINARKSGGHNENPVEAEFVFEAYGLNDLYTKKIAYQDRLAVLKEAGYDKTWDPASTISEMTWNAHHQEYLAYQQHLTDINAKISTKETKKASLEAAMSALMQDAKAVASNATLESYPGYTKDGVTHSSFTDNEIKLIKSLYRESDYSDSNFLLTDIDDALSGFIKKGKALMDAAANRLEIESLPQFLWTVDSNNLYAMHGFENLRDQLQVGDFITLGFDTYGIADYLVDMLEDKPNGIKFRIVEIDFSGIDFSAPFQITFSSMIHTRAYRNDFETLLESFVSSKTNQISSGITGTASTIAAKVSASLIRPYIEAQEAAINTVKINAATIDDLNATAAKIQNLTVFDLMVANIHASDETKKITLVSDSTGNIEIENSSMIFKDEKNNERVRIGRTSSGTYDITILSAADASGKQKTLFDSNKGIYAAAIPDQVIATEMVNWGTIAEGTDDDGKPYFAAEKVEVEGTRLSEAWESLKTELAGINIVASSQVFIDDSPASITLTPELHVVEDFGGITWYYKTPSENSWHTIDGTNGITEALDKTVTIVNTSPLYTSGNNIVQFKAVYSKQGVDMYEDLISIFKLSEGDASFTVILSNEAQTIATDDEYYPTDYNTYNCTVSVYKGVTPLTATTSSSPAANQFYVTATCTEQSVSLDTSNPGVVLMNVDPSITIPPDFYVNVNIKIGGFSSIIHKQISLSASAAGKSPIVVQIDSSAGIFFKNKVGTTILTCTVKKGTEDITSRVTQFKWTKYDKDGFIDNNWTRTMTGNAITITADDIQSKAVFHCEVAFD